MAMSMDRHHRDAVGGPCPEPLRRKLRRLSRGLLLTAAATAVTGRGIGVVTGVLSASLAAAAVVGVLGLRPQILARVMAIPAKDDRSA
jgi:hypothetical protein